MAHIVILPYYCEEEVQRYLKIAKLLAQFGPQETEYRFVLASSPRTQPSQPLFDAFSQIAPSEAYACPTQVFGYPEGPTAMFWDCLDYVAEAEGDDDGFCLWLESDMVPVKSNWLDQLSEQWHEQPRSPLVMGCKIPDVYKYRLFRARRQMAAAHINGGACYAKNFATKMPAEAREGTFDMAIYEHLQSMGEGQASDLITLSSIKHSRRDIERRAPVILHGFFQDKEQFVDVCVEIARDNPKKNVEYGRLNQLYDQTWRRLKVGIMRRGRRAFIETLLFQMDLELAKQKRATNATVGEGETKTEAETEPETRPYTQAKFDQLFSG